MHLVVRYGQAVDEICQLAHQLEVQAVFANHDDEPAALARDASVLGKLAHHGVMFHTYQRPCDFERQEVLTQQGRPFVFTPSKMSGCGTDRCPPERHPPSQCPGTGQCARWLACPHPHARCYWVSNPPTSAGLRLLPGSESALTCWRILQRIEHWPCTRFSRPSKAPAT